MGNFLRRLARHLLRQIATRSWAARRSFGVRVCFVLALIVLLVPFLRVCFQTQASKTSFSYVHQLLPFGSRGFPLAFSIKSLRARFPDDRDIQIASAEGDPLVYDMPETEASDDDETDDTPIIVTNVIVPNVPISSVQTLPVPAYDGLLKRLPNDPTIVAAWLRITGNAFRDTRVAGVLEATPTPSPPPGGWPTGLPSAPSLPPKPAAQPAQKTSPPRAAPTGPLPGPPSTPTPAPTPRPTPNYTPAQLNEAIAVARRGQQLEPDNAYFDWSALCFLLSAGRDDEALRVLDLAARKSRYDDHSCDVLQSFLRARARNRATLIEEKWTDVNTLGVDFGRSMHVARLLSWLAWQKSQRGDVAGEIKIRSDLARLVRMISDGRRSSLYDYFTLQLARIAWSRDLNSLASRRYKTVQRRASEFADYATVHNQPQIAAETLSLNGYFVTRQKLYTTYRGIFSGGVIGAILQGSGCLAAMAFALLSYVALSILLLLSKRADVPRRDVWTLTPWLIATMLCGVALFFLGTQQMQGNFFSPDNPEVNLTNESAETVWVLVGGAFLMFVAPLLLSAAWCAFATWQRDRKNGEKRLWSPAKTIVRYAFLLVWFSVLFYVVAYSLVAAVLALRGVNSWRVTLPVLGEGSFGHDLPTLAGMWFFVAVFSLCFWPLYARNYNVIALRRFRQTLLALVPLYGLLWVLVALLSIPSRHKAEAQLNALLRHGEVFVALNQSKYR